MLSRLLPVGFRPGGQSVPQNIVGVTEPVVCAFVAPRVAAISAADGPRDLEYQGSAAPITSDRGHAWDAGNGNALLATNTPSPAGNYTLFLLARIDNIETWGGVMGWSVSDGSAARIMLQKNSSSDELRVYHGGSSVNLSPGGVSTIADGQWDWLALTWDGANSRLYKAGAEVASVANALSISSAATDRVLLFRERSNSGSFEANGDIAAFYALNRAMGAGEVAWRSGDGQWDIFEAESYRTYLLPAAAGGGGATPMKPPTGLSLLGIGA